MLQRFHSSLAQSMEWFALSSELENHIWETREKHPPASWYSFGVHYDDIEMPSTHVAYLLDQTRLTLQYIPKYADLPY